MFREGLESIDEHLDGEAVLASLDGWITLSVHCDGAGSLSITGVVNDNPGVGNELKFSLDGIDQTYLPPIISALREVEARYPVRSQPSV